MLGIYCCYYSGPSIGCQLSTFSSSSGCTGVADVGAGNKAAHFSPEGWKFPSGITGRRAAGLAPAEGMGRACGDTGTSYQVVRLCLRSLLLCLGVLRRLFKGHLVKVLLATAMPALSSEPLLSVTEGSLRRLAPVLG